MDRTDPPKTGDGTGNRQVKTRKIFGEGSRGYWGEVVKIDEKEMHLRCVHSGDEKNPKVRVFLPIDLLTKGGVIEEALSGDSYRWQDIKKGDTIEAYIVTDVDEKNDYCIRIRIDRRPGGKIPECQKPLKNGVPHHVRANVLNDIDNGLDVSEEDIQRAFPLKPDSEDLPLAAGAKVQTDELPEKYREKLDANRKRIAKKEAELKAKPVADKTEVKKDDKK